MERQSGGASDTDGRSSGDAHDRAMSFLAHLASGQANGEDAKALRRWREESPQNREAFAEAKLLWEVLGPAAEHLAGRSHSQDALQDARAPNPRLGRRALIGGALAASAAAAGHVGGLPPFQLWPSLEELRADYHTKIGERRQLALADNVSLVLNTRTSIGIGSAPPGSCVIELIDGEAAVAANAPGLIDVIAAGGRVTAETARFNLRRDGATVRATCLEGVVRVACGSRSMTAPVGEQVTYDEGGLRDPLMVDPAVVSAWQHGQLIFKREPFWRVIEEVNRYRPGRIFLLDQKLGERLVVATFHLDRLEEAVKYLAQTFGARLRYLPGSIAVLS